MKRIESELEQIKSMVYNQPSSNVTIKQSTYDALQGFDEAGGVQTIDEMLEGDHSQEQIKSFVQAQRASIKKTQALLEKAKAQYK